MGFRIRDKSLFWTKSGWKNNWEPKILNMPRSLNPSQTMFLTSRYDHHSFLRLVQSYRNYSRVCKQYLYGDSQAINALILQLRSIFRIPYTCETPVALIKHGGQRRMADQIDRDYQLLSYNTHPGQLFMYEIRNKAIREQNQQADKAQKGEETLYKAFVHQLEKQTKQQESRLGPGEKISLQKMGEIYTRLAKLARQAQGDSKARRQDGQFNDFLQKRRPFLDPNPTNSTH